MENKFGDSQKNHTNQQKLINVNKIAYFWVFVRFSNSLWFSVNYKEHKTKLKI